MSRKSSPLATRSFDMRDTYWDYMDARIIVLAIPFGGDQSLMHNGR